MSEESMYDDLDADVEQHLSSMPQKAHDEVNAELLQLMKYRTERNWHATVSIIAIFAVIILLMMIFIPMGMDIQSEWKEILLVMLGAFVGSWAKVIDYWFNNSERDNALLKEGTTNYQEDDE